MLLILQRQNTNMMEESVISLYIIFIIKHITYNRRRVMLCFILSFSFGKCTSAFVPAEIIADKCPSSSQVSCWGELVVQRRALRGVRV